MTDTLEKPNGGRQRKPVQWGKLSVILTILAALGVGGVLWARYEENKRQRGIAGLAKIQMRNIAEKIEKFRADNGRYPTREEVDTIHGPDYVHGKLIDVWGSQYSYGTDPTGTKTFMLVSYGSDRLPGGTDHAADLVFTQDDLTE